MKKYKEKMAVQSPGGYVCTCGLCRSTCLSLVSIQLALKHLLSNPGMLNNAAITHPLHIIIQDETYLCMQMYSFTNGFADKRNGNVTLDLLRRGQN